MSTQAQFPWHLRAYSDCIYSLYMGTCEHDIKDAYEQLIPKTLKALLAKQTKMMYNSDISHVVELFTVTCKFLWLNLGRVNEAEFTF